MFNAITISSIYVLDQDEALDFYVGKLGLEVGDDIDMGFMRWLTVNVPGQPDRAVLLELVGPPSLDDATAEQVRELVAKGAMGFSLGLTTDDADKAYAELEGKGVEMTQEVIERFYGKDFGYRDPFGNHGRITEPAENMVVPDDPGAEFEAPEAS